MKKLPLKHTQIDAFRAVMSTGSITRAALLLNKSQPSVTRFIRDLEEEIGFALFLRTGSRIVPTDDAVSFLKEVERSFAGLLALEKSAAEIRQLSEVPVSVATISAATFTLLPETAAALQAKGHGLKVSTFIHRSPKVVERVRLQQAALGFCNIRVPEPGISILAKYSWPSVAVVPGTHELASRGCVSLEDLAANPFISLGNEYFAAQGVSGKQLSLLRRATTIETHLTHSACSYVLQGLGVAISDPLTAGFFERLGLKAVPLQPVIPYDFAIIQSSFFTPSRGVSKFLELLITNLDNY